MIGYLLIAAFSVASAVLMTIAAPEPGYGHVVFVALVPLLWAMWGASSGRRAFFGAWLAGFVFFLVNIRWVLTPINHFGNAPMWVSIIVLVLFSVVLGLFWGVFGYVAGRTRGGVTLATVWVGLEVFKSTVLSGFPWLNLAQTLYADPLALQAASLVGEFGLSFIIVLVNVYAARAIMERKSMMLVSVMTILALLYVFGGVRLSFKLDAGVGDVRARIIQPAYAQEDKWNPLKQEELIASVSELIEASMPDDYDLLVLPESVFPAYLQNKPEIMRLMGTVSKTTPVILGSIRFEDDGENTTYHNSIYLYENGRLKGTYDKRHLVPFGEYFPLKGLFKPIHYYFFGDADDFSKGTEAKILETGKMSIAPLICYEGAYTALLRDPVVSGANVVVLVSNDSWFGDSLGRTQHLAIDVLRAVEYDRAVIRATQSGISAFITGDGVIAKSLGIGEKGYLDGVVALESGNTLFARIQYAWLIVIIAWLLARRFAFGHKLGGERVDDVDDEAAGEDKADGA